MTEIKFINISKSYSQEVLKDLNLIFKTGDCIRIEGSNGSGKSTLLQIACGIKMPDSGKLIISKNKKNIDYNDFYKYCGVISPYLHFYEELTAFENIELFSKNSNSKKTALDYIRYFGIDPQSKYRNLSSGMRMKIQTAFCFCEAKDIYFLDEPFTNMDQEGVDFINKKITELSKSSIILIATNREDININFTGSISLEK